MPSAAETHSTYKFNPESRHRIKWLPQSKALYIYENRGILSIRVHSTVWVLFTFFQRWRELSGWEEIVLPRVTYTSCASKLWVSLIIEITLHFEWVGFCSTTNSIRILPSDWYLDEVLLLAMPKKDGWEGLADVPRVMEIVVSRWIGGEIRGLYRRASSHCVKGAL